MRLSLQSVSFPSFLPQCQHPLPLFILSSLLPNQEIIDSVRKAVSTSDLVITTGGIGSTHDDITYESIAAAFGDKTALDQPTVDRMFTFYGFSDLTSARLRMARLPSRCTTITVPNLWVPIAVVEKKCHIFPGIPSYFERMLNVLRTSLPDGPDSFHTNIYSTQRESDIADFLRDVADRYAEKNIEIGSYPHMEVGRPLYVRISIFGYLDSLVEEVASVIERGVNGSRTLPDVK